MIESATESAIEMYAYHGQLGLKRSDLQYCSVVQDEANPDVWSSNKAFAVRASSPAEINKLMREVDVVFAQLPYRHFVVDPLTPKSFEAYLALNEYVEYAAIIQMVLTGALKTRAMKTRAIKTREALSSAKIWPVSSDADWALLRSLVLIDHAEGARTQSSLSEVVTDGIVAGYRAKAGPCQFFLAKLDGQACAYGSGTNCPNGMGMVEDLFTVQDFRRRGLASQMISHCVEFCRARGADQILIGSHSSEPPKHLYNKLGFDPVFLTRDLIKR